ncbi:MULTISPECIES: F0F1 ATP synthase subunit B [Commensalibacter]|uniref:ATP synthase subunit b n=2 Tax=Commensalibacter TaxID=1079922 RepID=W7DZ59_9PROT|nr:MULTISPECIES: F0F1 ATP synthase subunit B [Commensalibacter]EUK17994.1 H+transporting two-sector ATPase subunit B/B' [Commensalibacter papalotli (ex Servin-Garciduenas et al. 2014)]CAI3940496.1 FoF1-type ATP synthase [Commensalibacter papalotli (ex Botero et al. 2024)]CAI3950518.1 FoF1-type ATP synthase [Commensalibacter papalotli (ex Botero et al. 2024)]
MHLLQEPHFWSAVAFVLFFVFFGKKLWRPLAAAMDNRTNQVRQELEEASRLRREAEEIYTAAQKEHEAAKFEAEKMLAASKEAAERIAENAKKEADAAAHRHEELVRLRLAASEQEAVNMVRREAADIAVKAAYEVISSVLTEEKDTPLIDNAIADLPKALAADRHVA